VIDYAQARMQARHGAAPQAHTWALVHASMTLGSLLENARGSALESWIAGLDPAATRAEAEKLIEERLLARIEELAAWMPEEWRAAVAHTRALLALPARQRELRRIGDAAGADAIRRAWLERWRALWPIGTGEEEPIGELLRAVDAHLERFARAPPEEAEALRLALRDRVGSLFRRHALTPAAAFDHLLLLALEAERVRAEVLGRCP
jgi:hypothetical protein